MPNIPLYFSLSCLHLYILACTQQLGDRRNEQVRSLSKVLFLLSQSACDFWCPSGICPWSVLFSVDIAHVTKVALFNNSQLTCLLVIFLFASLSCIPHLISMSSNQLLILYIAGLHSAHKCNYILQKVLYIVFCPP